MKWMWSLCVAVGVVTLAARPVRAQTSRHTRTLHPVFAAVPHVPNGDEAHMRFAAAAARHRMGPVEVIDVPTPPAPHAAAALAAAKKPLETLKFAEARAALTPAVAEARATGADGLSHAQLADLFLHHAMALQEANWTELATPLTEITPPEARAAYLQAATLAPDRVLEARRFPPIAIASYKLAAAEVKARPRGALVVRAASSALISVDGRPPAAGLTTVQDLPYGEHFIRVEDPGRRAWAQVVPLAELTMTIDAPVTEALSLQDARAAEAARRQEAAFALVAELTPGPKQQIALRLVDAATGARQDATNVPFLGDPGQLDAALKNLDEQAVAAEFGTRKTTLVLPGQPDTAPAREVGVSSVPSAPSRGVPAFGDDPSGWARARWPLLTAVGVTVGAALVLGIAASN